jgi:hypothetical protein
MNILLCEGPQAGHCVVHYILLRLVGHCACMHDTNNALHSMHLFFRGLLISCIFIYLYLFLALDYLLIYCLFIYLYLFLALDYLLISCLYIYLYLCLALDYLLIFCTFYFFVKMTRREFVFEVHYGGHMDRRFMNTYVGGDVDVYTEAIEHDKLSFSVVLGIAKNYGYQSGDLIYYLLPGCTLHNGLKLVTSNFDVREMVEAHVGLPVVELYINSFSESIPDNDDDDYGDDEGGCSRIDRDDLYWDEVNEPDLFVQNNDVTGPSTSTGMREGSEDRDGCREGEDSEEGDKSEEQVVDEGSDDDDDDDDDDANSDMARSDILTSPPKSDEDYEVASQSRRKHVTKRSEFHLTDMGNPEFVVGKKFPSIQVFREAVRECNVKMGKDVKFKRNYLAKCVVICRDEHCKYRIYGRKCKDEESFEVRSFQPKHSCRRRHENSILKSNWIADKLIDKFRAQPNMPVKAIVEEVKGRWGVDVKEHRLYRARKLAKDKIRGKLDEQYNKLWDYLEMIRVTNASSCVMMKIERPLPDIPGKFQRLYFSLAAMKRGFLAGCRPIIGLDGCFLKGPHKGQLLAAISRDANNQMYPVAFAVVEAETKDSWTWFLEALLSDLGTPPAEGWTFISDRQKVKYQLKIFLHIINDVYVNV